MTEHGGMTGHGGMRGRLVHVLLGGAVSVALFMGVAAISQWPEWQSVPPDDGVIRLSLRHGGARLCRTATDEELARLPANMRLREICERRRAPVHVRAEIDGQPLIDRDVQPSGLWGTGPSRLYARFPLPAGRHEIALTLTDDPVGGGERWELRREVTVAPGENLGVDFRPEAGGFILYESGGDDG